MNHRVRYHRAPRGPLEYALDARKAPSEGLERGRPQIVASNMTSQVVPDLVREFEVFLAARPYVERPAVHIVLAPHPDDLETLTPQVRRELIETYLARQGYGNAPYVAVEHWDSGVRHYSVITSRVDAAGDLIQSAWEGRVGKEVLYELEERYGLVRTGPGPGVRAPDCDQIQRRARLKAQGRVEERVVDEIRERVDAVLRPGLTAADFARQLGARSVSLQFRTGRDGRISGVSYGWHRDGHVRAASGSSLGAAYTWPGLQRLSGLSYNPARDRIDLMLNPPLEEPSPRVVPPDAPKLSPPPSLQAQPVTVPPRAASGPAATPGPGATLEQILNRLEQLRELERAESALRYEVQQLDDPHWAYLKLNPYRHEMSAHLAGLYPDRGVALDALERLFAEESRRHPTAPGEAAAAVLDRLNGEPEVLGELRKRKTLLGEKPLTGKDREVQAQLPELRRHAQEFLDRKVALDAEASRRESRLREVRRELREVEKQLRAAPSSRVLVQEAIPEVLALEPRSIQALALRFPTAMRSIELARSETWSLGLGGD